jgi:hypothetical protein
MLRRMVLLCGALLVGVMLLGGVALAKDIRGTFKEDVLQGTTQMDRINGLGAADTIAGKAGNDDCYGGSGANMIRCAAGNDRIDGGFGEDELFGGGGNDTISAADGQVDQGNCGEGDDTVYVDEPDVVNADCQNVPGPPSFVPSPLCLFQSHSSTSEHTLSEAGSISFCTSAPTCISLERELPRIRLLGTWVNNVFWP